MSKFKPDGIKPAFLQGGFKAFVQTVLPTIYDDSLSYYELLNKVVKYLNTTNEAVNTLSKNQYTFFHAVTDYINNNVPTFDVVINSTFTTLDSDTVTELYNAVANNRLARIIVSVPDSNISYACYYATHDTETVETKPANDLYFIGYKLKRITYGTRYFNEVIVKVTENGQVTTYSDFNIVTKSYVDTMLVSTESRLLDYIDDNNKTAIVNFTVTRENNIPVVTGTKTPSEIKALVDNGNAVICKLTDSPDKTISNCVICHAGEVIILFSDVEHPYPYTEKAVPLSYDIIHGKYTDFDGWVYQDNYNIDNRVVFGITRKNNDFDIGTFTHTPKEVVKLLQNSGFNPVSFVAGFTRDNGAVDSVYSETVGTTLTHDNETAVHTVLIRFITGVNETLNILGNDSTNTWTAFKDTIISHIAESRIVKAYTDTNATIQPNKLYVFPEMARLTITLGAITDNSVVNEYHFMFTSGATATTLSIPATVKQPDGFTVEANHVYEVSIMENCMTAQGWAVTA